MKKICIYVMCMIIFLMIIGFIFFAIINSKKSNENSINDKISSEVEYLDGEILEIMNGLNNMRIGLNVNIEKQEEKVDGKEENNESGQSNEDATNSGEQSENASSEKNQKEDSNTNEIEYLVKDIPVVLVDRENINWENLVKTAERLYSSWATIIIDLNSVNIQNENILNFSSNLDNLILNLKNNNKQQSLVSLANMYSLLPEYIDSVNGISEQYYILKLKSGVLKAYATIEYEKWDIVNAGMQEASDATTSLINSEIMFNNKHQSKIEETYVLLKELEKTANNKEKDMFMLKYVTLMEKIDTYTN